jgi:hypothetical protein
MENQNREEVLIHLKSMNDEIKKKIKANKTMLAEMIARMDANHNKRMARMNAWLTELKTNQKETPACQGTMEACLETEEPASVETTPEVADEQEAPVQDAAVMPVRGLRKQRRDRNKLQGDVRGRRN